MKMHKHLLASLTALLLVSCAPVLSKNLMREGERNVSLAALRANPDAYKGKLYILGGLIVETKYTGGGSLIEALYVPVNSYGSLGDPTQAEGRYLAIYPKDRGMLDPLIYKKGREITIAGTFLELRQGKIDDMEYTYPVFEIRQLYLWDERRDYYGGPGYPYYYRPFYPYGWYDPWYDPWWHRPYPPPGWW